MNSKTGIQLAHNQSCVNYSTLETDPITNELYIKSNTRYLGVAFTQTSFPVNGVVIDFSYLKLAMKEIIQMFQGKLVLCARSTLYTVNLDREHLVVQTGKNKMFMCQSSDCFVINNEAFSDQVFCQIFSVCMETIVKNNARNQRFLNAEVSIMKMKNSQKVKVAGKELDF